MNTSPLMYRAVPHVWGERSGVSPPITKGEALLRAGDLRSSPPSREMGLASVPLIPGFDILLGGYADTPSSTIMLSWGASVAVNDNIVD